MNYVKTLPTLFINPQGWKKWSKKEIFCQVMRSKKGRFASLSTTWFFALQKIDLPDLLKLNEALYFIRQDTASRDGKTG